MASNIWHSWMTMFRSHKGIIGLIGSPCLPSTIPSITNDIKEGTYFSNNRCKSSLSDELHCLVETHLFQNGVNLKFLGSTNTIPHLDTVAGEAYCKSPTSKSRAQCFWSRIRSPLARVRSLLSSMTEFMFSTHRASTSPSNRMYFLSFLSVGLLISRKMFDNNPSVQSLVVGSRIPYNSMTL